MEKEKQKNNSMFIIIIVILVVIIIGLIFYIEKDKIFELFNSNKNNENNNIVDTKEDKTYTIDDSGNKVEENKVDLSNVSSLVLDDTTNYSNSIKLYYSKNDKTSFCYTDNVEYCNSEYVEIKTEESSAKKIELYRNKYLLYKDNGKIKLYNNDEKKSYIINISSNYNSYTLDVDKTSNKLVGIIFQEKNSGPYSFYSILSNKILYDKKYDVLEKVNENTLSGGYNSCVNNSCNLVKVELISTKEEKVYASVENSAEFDYYPFLVFSEIRNKDDFFYTLEIQEGYIMYKKIYTSDYKEILSFDEKELYDGSISVNDKGNLYVIDDKVVNVYDLTGKLIKTSKTYDEVFEVIDQYIVAVKNNKLLLTTIDEKELAICDWSSDKQYHSLLSGWYTENGKNGIYLIVQDPSASLDDVWNYYKNTNEFSSKEELSKMDLGYEYYYIPTTGELGKIPTYIGGYAKPVLYLYPEKETKVTITFAHPENLTTTYPKYTNNWTVYANKNGDLRDLNNNYYYALYWEENLNHRVSFNEGFYVTKNNAINFLEEKLSILGFNDKERNEFIMYWLPILEKNEKSLVYFELTNERDSYSKLNITPKPDSMLRVAIHVKKVNNYVNIKEQTLKTFDRNGFSVVEWGGVLY